jgi:hypothetical protein
LPRATPFSPSAWANRQSLSHFLCLGTLALCAQDRPIVLKTSTIYDGKGRTLHNTNIVVEGSKITYDASELAVTPGWIDTHAHIVYHFDSNKSFAGCSPPIRCKAITFAASIGRDSTERTLGVSLSSPICVRLRGNT